MTAGGDRYLIVNADDLGMSGGINAGIIRAYREGVVTAASLMVTRPFAREAVAVVSDVPPSLGLHIDLGEWEPVDGEPKESYQRVDLEDAAAVAAEIQRQVDLFIEILGRPPDHLDSHQHVHLGGVAREASIEAARRLDVPLRGVGRIVTVCGGFYGQQRDFGPYLEGVSFENLLRLLDGMPAGWNELTCHPGLGHDVPSVYAKEREVELETLCRPELRDAVAERHITLRDFRTVPSST